MGMTAAVIFLVRALRRTWGRPRNDRPHPDLFGAGVLHGDADTSGETAERVDESFRDSALGDSESAMGAFRGDFEGHERD